MSFLSRLLGYVPGDERKGIHIEDRQPWKVETTKDAETFLRALGPFAAEGTFVYFEDIPFDEVRTYLRGVSVPPAAQVEMGTIWPRPECFHAPLTADGTEALAQFLADNPTALLCIHLIVYRDDAVLLQWYDVFDNPIYLARSVPEEAVSRFAKAIGSKYSIGW
jgi:hypothetical protein